MGGDIVQLRETIARLEVFILFSCFCLVLDVYGVI